MKAAVIHAFGDIPQYQDFPDPIPAEGETLVHVKAVVLENIDKLVAGGTHYSSRQFHPAFPAIVGISGVGMTDSGELVSFANIQQPYGAFAEKVVARRVMPLDAGIDVAKAAALPRSILTSLLPLKYAAKLEPGETVLINGATGVSGRIAVQLAKMLGASTVIATGRNQQSLALLTDLGADVVIDLGEPEDKIKAAFRKEDINVVVDFIWGRPAEMLIDSFIPNEAGFARRRVRYIQIGEKAGAHISLPAAALRTSGLELMGIGKIDPETLATEMAQVWNWIREDKFYMDIEQVPLADIAVAWQRGDLGGKRLVVIP